MKLYFKLSILSNVHEYVLIKQIRGNESVIY